MRYQLLIFDWDGTLADSLGLIVSNMQTAIAAIGLPPRRDEDIRELIGLGFVDGLKRLFPDLDPAEVMRLLEAYRREAPSGAFAAPFFPGATEVLKRLHGAAYRLAVATGKTRFGLERSLAHHRDIASLFECTRCADETADKPDPAMLREILAVTRVPVAGALMIGDTEYDAQMAAALGMTMLGVASGGHDAGRLRRAGAIAVLDDVTAIEPWLEARAG